MVAGMLEYWNDGAWEPRLFQYSIVPIFRRSLTPLTSSEALLQPPTYLAFPRLARPPVPVL